MKQQIYLAAALQCSPHLFFSYTEGENIVVVVLAFYEACGTQQCHVVGTKVLQRKAVGGTAFHSHLILSIHHTVCLERLLLLVFLKVPGTQRHLTLQTGLHSHRLLIYTVVTKNLHPLRFSLRLIRQLWRRGEETLDDAAEFEVFLQGIHTLVLLAALWATWKCFVIFVISFRSHQDTGPTVVVATGENHRISVELKTDGATQLVG